MSGGNPFAELTVSIPTGAIQFFVFLMIVLVIAGTLFDVWHKRSAQYFFENMKKSKSRARRKLGGGDDQHDHQEYEELDQPSRN